MRTCSYAVAVMLLFLSPTGTVCQQVSAGHFATFKDLLRERNIELSEPALVTALQNPDSHVRYLAALVLAEDKATDAIPAVTEALSVEKIPETRVNIALALAQLGEEKGLVALKGTCNGADTPPDLRIYAAKYLLDLHREGCLNAVTEVVQSRADFGSRVLALSLLPRFQHVSSGDSQKILDAILRALADTQSEVRVAASSALVGLGNGSAIPPLRRAIAIEQDENVRSKLQADLQSLQAREQH